MSIFWFAKVVLVWLKNVFLSFRDMRDSKALLFFQKEWWWERVSNSTHIFSNFLKPVKNPKTREVSMSWKGAFRFVPWATSQLAVANGILGFVDCCGCYIRYLMSETFFVLCFFNSLQSQCIMDKVDCMIELRIQVWSKLPKSGAYSRGCVDKYVVESR